ncbi:MAG TPA: helix-turn-helix domain-containing protein [Thermomicrobiales bacterium]|nr:helix-turn-helix domain-containing protein [Thermomicrobiales bacterium]
MVEPTTFDESRYLELVRSVPLRPIRTDGELAAAIAAIDRLLDQATLSLDEQDYLDVLGGLVEEYEDEHIDISPVRGVRALAHLMEENGLRQADLAHLFGGKSAISEVLRGNRALSKQQIVRLRDYFHVPADLFIE